MKTTIAAVAVAACVLSTSRAEAQLIVRGRAPAAAWASVPPSYSAAPVGVATRAYPSSYVPPYSYYAAPYPLPARIYVGYGSNDFPFYGKPYGHPYDPWTWPYLSGGSYGSLARYYYPPL
jgi:hypothetical protein